MVMRDVQSAECVLAAVIIRKGLKLKIWGRKRLRAENVHGDKP